MRIIARRTLREFYDRAEYSDARGPLEAWYAEARNAAWRSPADVKALYKNASIIHGNRIVFNIAGNKYRLIVKANYALGILYVRFVGTHKQYDAIDAEVV